jgi:hypothetical protein
MAPADSPEEDQVPSDKTSDKRSAVAVGMSFASMVAFVALVGASFLICRGV